MLNAGAGGEDPRAPDAAPAPQPPLPSVLDVLESTTDAVVLVDDDWRLTYLNRHAQRILARGRDLVGVPLHDLFRPEKDTAAWIKTQAAARTRQSASFEFYGSEQRTWFEVHVHPMRSGLQFYFRDVTARHNSKDALTEAEERLRLALEAAGDGAWDWDILSDQVSMSTQPSGGPGHGVDSYQGPASKIARWIHGDDAAQARELLCEHLAGRSASYQCEYRALSKDRQWRWVLVRGRVVARDPVTGRATRMVGISSDITDRKQAQDVAVEQARLLSMAQYAAGAGSWNIDLKRLNMTLSPGCWAKLRRPMPKGGIISLREWIKIVHPADRASVKERLFRAVRRRASFEVDYRISLPDGRIRWTHSLGSFVPSFSGGSDRLVGLVFDRTDAKLAQDALRESEERLRLTLDATGDGAWEWDFRDGAFSAQSQPIYDRLGYASGTLEQNVLAYSKLIHPDDLDRLTRDLKAHLKGRSAAFNCEYRLRTASGDWMWIRDRGRVVEHDPQTGRAVRMVGTYSDITAHKHAALELQRVQGELIHLSRLSAMGAMASTLAHELNQPLTAMANYVAGLRHAAPERVGADPLLAEALAGLECTAARAGQIVRRLRDYVTKGEMDRRPVSVATVIDEACALALVDAPELGVDVRLDIAPDLPPVLADQVQIQQVLLNLLRNAVEAMAASPRRRLEIAAFAEDETVRISVRDSGPGLAEKMDGQLFTPFMSSKADGMGVGLSICRTIVEAHDGRIWAECPPTGGMRFEFALPAAN